MKAITLWQPWASLIAIGAKQYETRSWSTTYRGPIAIHAAMKHPDYFPYDSIRVLREAGFPTVPRGVVVAVAKLVDVIGTCPLASNVSPLERQFGDWRCGRFAWKLEDVQMMEPPIKASGKQGLWNWTPPQDLANR